jgi:excisionase family DNA binding protein
MMGRWITITEASELSGYHKDTLRKLACRNKIRGRKFVTVWEIDKASLLTYLQHVERMGAKRGPKKEPESSQLIMVEKREP